jgi:4-hydroxybenzoate polyprenyltransferase
VIKAIVKSMRPRQWLTKNFFVFAALIFDVKLFQWQPLLRTVLGFVLFCLISGAVYIINDIADIEKDRAHPTKRLRPIASGAVSKNIAAFFAIILTVACLALGFALEPSFGLILGSYWLIQLAYSFVLKNMVILDVMTIAAGFVLRVAGGVPLVHVERFSPWLYVVMTLLALFMALGKRRQEIVLVEQGNNKSRAILDQYSLPLLDEMLAVVTAGIVMTYAFYTFSAPNMPANHTMMLTIPFVIYGIFRYLFIIHILGNGGAPDEVILQDRPLQLTVLLYGLAVIIIMYFFH